MGVRSDDEVDVAVRDYLARGEQNTDYERWADLFTDDAVYVEHSMGTFVGGDAIRRWIVACMGQFSAATNWTEWYLIDGDRVVIYAWNNFPAVDEATGPAQFPSVSVLRYAGDGQFVRQDDFYDADASEALVASWIRNGGDHDMTRDMTLEGIDGWQPPVLAIDVQATEISDSLDRLIEHSNVAASSGDWSRWASLYADDATYRVSYDEALQGREAVESWAPTAAQNAPHWQVKLLWHTIEGARAVARLGYSASPFVDGATFEVMAVLHYAGAGRWAYREDVFNPREIAAARERLQPRG